MRHVSFSLFLALQLAACADFSPQPDGEGEGEGDVVTEEFVPGCAVTSLDLTSCNVLDQEVLQADCDNGDRYEVVSYGPFGDFRCVLNGVDIEVFNNETLCDLDDSDEADRRQVVVRAVTGCNLGSGA